MVRRLSATLALLSLLLSLGVTALWVASHRHAYSYERETRAATGRDWVHRRTYAGVTAGVFCWSYIVSVQTLPIEAPLPPAPQPPRWTRMPRHPMDTRIYGRLPRTSLWNRLGFIKFYTAVGGPTSQTTTARYAPMWSLALASALPAAAWLATRGRAALRAKVRRRRGLCPACGYDLRGSESDRCPECGFQGTRG